MSSETIKNNSYLTKEILSEEILNHDLNGLRKDLLAFYEIRDSEVLNEGLKAHFPKREKLINRLVEIELKELEIKQNGRKLAWVIVLGIANLILVGSKVAMDFYVEDQPAHSKDVSFNSRPNK